MSICLAILTHAAITGNVATPLESSIPPAVERTESETVGVARQWLERGDAGDWKATYAATSKSFQSVNTLALWTSTSLSVRVPLGRVISRQLIDDIDSPTPPNGNRIVRFRTSFANRPNAVETVALVSEGGQWRIVGVYLE